MEFSIEDLKRFKEWYRNKFGVIEEEDRKLYYKTNRLLREKYLAKTQGKASYTMCPNEPAWWFHLGNNYSISLDLAKKQYEEFGIRWKIDGKEVLDYKNIETPWKTMK